MRNLIDQLTPDDLVLTANQRQSRFLRDQYDRAQAGASWASPTIVPLHTWVSSFWQQFLQTSHILLSAEQECQLWQTIIQDSIEGVGLLQPTQAAKLAQNAWRLLQDWQQPLSVIQNSTQPDVHTFFQWASEFERICEQRHWQSPSALTAQIIAELDQLKHRIPQRIWCYGFERPTPIFKLLINKLGGHSNVVFNKLRQEPQSPHLIRFEQQPHELEAMVQWLQQQMQLNPHALIAAIVPNLNQHAQEIRRLVQRTFATEADRVNISAGYQLSELPLVVSALSTLGICSAESVSALEFSEFIRSPFISGGVQHQLARAQFDLKFRQQATAQMPWQALENIKLPTNLQQLWNYVLHFRVQISSPRPASDWTSMMLELLDAVGWPGDCNLSSPQYQTQQRFFSLVDELAQFDLVCGEITFSEALSLLQRLAQDTQFQPESRSQQIQILGMLEASGLEFDQVWLQGMTDDAWPPVQAPNPMLPVKLQRQWQMPHADVAYEYQYCERILNGILTAARKAVVSYHVADGDLAKGMSSLLEPFSSYRDASAPSSHDFNLPSSLGWTAGSRAELFVDPAVKPRDDGNEKPQNHGTEKPRDGGNKKPRRDEHYAPPLSSSERYTKGSYLFKAQAMCPFKAFAECRLGATSVPEIPLSLTPAERGEIVHAILQQFWQDVGSSAALAELEVDEVRQKIQQTTAKVLQWWQLQKPHSLPNALRKLEQQRLEALVLQWLELEQTRAPFSVVSVEQRQQISVNGIELDLRVDRIDRLPTGEHLIIDYKTGRTSINGWLAERPYEPQLPLYSMAGVNLAGLTLAEVRSETCIFKGLTKSNDVLPKVKASTDWDQQIQTWRDQLSDLAQEFKVGFAKVEPLSPALTCQYCECQPLCRIQELSS